MCCFTLNKFCGLSLPTASIVIGWLSAIISMLQTIACIAILFCLDRILVMVGSGFGKNSVELENIGFLICVYVALYLGVSILDLVASALVIMGTHKMSHLMLLPWLINNMFVLVVRFPFNFIWLANIFGNSPVPIEAALLFLVYWGAHCWIWTAIYSHFRVMRQYKDMLLESDQKRSANNYELFKNHESAANATRY